MKKPKKERRLKKDRRVVTVPLTYLQEAEKSMRKAWRAIKRIGK